MLPRPLPSLASSNRHCRPLFFPLLSPPQHSRTCQMFQVFVCVLCFCWFVGKKNKAKTC
jgi:hypothetical protein